MHASTQVCAHTFIFIATFHWQHYFFLHFLLAYPCYLNNGNDISLFRMNVNQFQNFNALNCFFVVEGIVDDQCVGHHRSNFCVCIVGVLDVLVIHQLVIEVMVDIWNNISRWKLTHTSESVRVRIPITTFCLTIIIPTLFYSRKKTIFTYVKKLSFAEKLSQFFFLFIKSIW